MAFAADTEKTVGNLMSLLIDSGAPSAADAGEEGAEEAKLTDERKKQVDDLFLSFMSGALSNPIKLSDLAAVKVDNGPTKEDVLSGLAAMDANGDGLIEIDEMYFYFAFVGQALTDTDFDTVVNNLKDGASLFNSLSSSAPRASGDGPSPAA